MFVLWLARGTYSLGYGASQGNYKQGNDHP